MFGNGFGNAFGAPLPLARVSNVKLALFGSEGAVLIENARNDNSTWQWDNESVKFSMTEITPDDSPSDYDLLVVCIGTASLHELGFIVDKMPPVSGPACLCMVSRNRRANDGDSPFSADDAAMVAEHLGLKSWIVDTGNSKATLFRGFYDCFKGKIVCIPQTTSSIERPSDDVFREFCRVFGPSIRSAVPGDEAKVLDLLVKMWRRAPPQLKMKLKRDIRRYPFAKSDELQIPIP